MLQRVSSSTSRPPEPMRDPQPWSQRRAGGVVSGAGRGRCSPKFSRVAAAVRRSPSSVSRSGPYGPCRIRSWPARREAAAVADNLGGRWLLADESSRRGEAIPRKTRSDLPGDSARRAVLAATGGSSARRRPRRQVSVATRARRIIARSIWAAVGPLSRRTRRAPRAVPSPSTTCRPITRVTGTTDPYGLWGRFRCMAFYRQSLPASYIAAGLR